MKADSRGHLARLHTIRRCRGAAAVPEPASPVTPPAPLSDVTPWFTLWTGGTTERFKGSSEKESNPEVLIGRAEDAEERRFGSV